MYNLIRARRKMEFLWINKLKIAFKQKKKKFNLIRLYFQMNFENLYLKKKNKRRKLTYGKVTFTNNI